jgi:hypothetical protein
VHGADSGDVAAPGGQQAAYTVAEASLTAVANWHDRWLPGFLYRPSMDPLPSTAASPTATGRPAPTPNLNQLTSPASTPFRQITNTTQEVGFSLLTLLRGRARSQQELDDVRGGQPTDRVQLPVTRGLVRKGMAGHVLVRASCERPLAHLYLRSESSKGLRKNGCLNG